MRLNPPFLSPASNAILKSGGLLRWKERLVKDAILSLPLTEVMKIARLTSPLPDAPCQSLPRLRLRHGWRLALLVHLNLTLIRSVAGSSSCSPNFSNCSSPRESASVYAAYLRSHFSVSQPKALRSTARGYLSELRRATCPKESLLSFCSPFSPAEFLAAVSNSFSTATGPDKVAQLMLKHLPRFGIDFLLHISIFPGFYIPFLPSGRHLLLFPSTRWESLSTFLLPSGLASRLSCFPPGYHSFLIPPFYLVYSSCWSLIPFFLPDRPVSALDGLL